MSASHASPVPVLALLRAAHAGPTVAVTGFALAWGVLGVGLPAAALVLLGAAVLSGQLAIGWTNDWADAGRDRASGRTDKPVAAGQVGRGQVGAAALVAAGLCVLLSLWLGPAAGAVHLVAVASGLAYDLGLKSTPASPLPFAVSFGLLPAVATLAAAAPGGPAWPTVPVLLAAALLGVAAHLANTVPDAEDDARTGVRGLPQRLGPRASAVGAGVVVAGAALVLLPGALTGPGSRGPVAAALLAVGVLLGVAAAVTVLRVGRDGAAGDRGAASAGRAVGRGAFWLVVAAAGAVVLGFLVG
ncbi:UbiA family prenyltransferase [Jannaschia sp. R86511]|uniref:UbiA family prenyltransferase n=1 Tax=Jannaschia sp. R86511 TaxID=3093853 RepID=UPI0036D2A497